MTNHSRVMQRDGSHRVSCAVEPQFGQQAMSKSKAVSKGAKGTGSPSKVADATTEETLDWRAQTLARVRTLIQQADPDVVEEVKWRKPSNGMRGVPVWSHGGII